MQQSNPIDKALMRHLTSMHFVNNMKTKVDINNIVDRFDKRIKYRYDIYKKVLLQINKRISVASRIFQYQCVYHVPCIVSGKLIPDQKECICFLLFKLRRDGIQCEYTSPNILHVSWEKIVKQKLKQRYKKRVTKKRKYIRDKY